jgi:hypothetical protein
MAAGVSINSIGASMPGAMLRPALVERKTPFMKCIGYQAGPDGHITHAVYEEITDEGVHLYRTVPDRKGGWEDGLFHWANRLYEEVPWSIIRPRIDITPDDLLQRAIEDLVRLTDYRWELSAEGCERLKNTYHFYTHEPPIDPSSENK